MPARRVHMLFGRLLTPRPAAHLPADSPNPATQNSLPAILGPFVGSEFGGLTIGPPIVPQDLIDVGIEGLRAGNGSALPHPATT